MQCGMQQRKQPTSTNIILITELLAKAKDTYALHCQEQTIEAEQPVVWHAVDAPVEV